MMKTLLTHVVLFAVLAFCVCDNVFVIYEASESDLLTHFKQNVDSSVTFTDHQMNHDDDSDTANFCTSLEAEPISAVVDLTWGGWSSARDLCHANGVPYVHVEASNKPFVMGVDDFLSRRSAIDAALLFETESEVDQSLYHIIGNYNLRVLVLSMAETDPFMRMEDLRPVPSAFVAFGTTAQVTEMLKKAQAKKLVRRDSRWNFVIEDFDAANFATSGLEADVNIISATQDTCCGLNDMSTSDLNACLAKCKNKPKQLIVKKAGEVIGQTVSSMSPSQYSCTMSGPVNNTRVTFMADLTSNIGTSSKYQLSEDASFSYPVQLEFVLSNKSNQTLMDMGKWTEATGMGFTENFKDVPIPRFFRVGMAVAVPWLYESRNEKGEVEKDEKGNIVYKGYCMDLLEKISKKLSFEFEVVITKENRPGYAYGRKMDDGSWTGMIGDLANGDTDLIVADLTMTSEREEVIDFVSPYFDQAGISIVLRKRERQQSLFKFLSVLRPEVWLGIVAAVIITAVLIWLLDRYSPYSARNNKAAYPYPCRDFTLKESFWFALTSLTPQGGGEAPKALSGRVLVAAYWLFVVLMLATFTANLAAFLTVERMQTTVQSLEELARQSRINYTVVANTSYMEYFVNMAGAEEELYHKWKELTLNSSGNPAKYRVWDYPIREQYTHILKVIEETGTVQSTKEGFTNVLEHVEGDYAFIHDAARIKYEVYNNCNLTEIGEPFAEQPYALAVQQGSHLQEELSRVILELQKDRYFESLQSKYWNSSASSKCPVMDDSEGITLQSLGGVFIATLIGLGLALVTLAVEVVLQKKKEGRSKVEDSSGKSSASMEDVANGSDPIRKMNRGMPAIIGH